MPWSVRSYSVALRLISLSLSLCAPQPKTIKRKLEATAAFKQYQCKFSKRAGYLYLSQSDGMWHQHCRFGLVSKVHLVLPVCLASATPPTHSLSLTLTVLRMVQFEFPRSRIENIVANGSVAEVLLDPSVAKKGETYKLYFEDDLKCLEAVAIMNNLLQQYQGLQGETGALSCSSGELPSLPAHSPRLNDDEAEGDEEEDFQFVRAIVVESYVPKSKGELALHAQDVVRIQALSSIMTACDHRQGLTHMHPCLCTHAPTYRLSSTKSARMDGGSERTARRSDTCSPSTFDCCTSPT